LITLKKKNIVNITIIDAKKYKLTIYRLRFYFLFFAFAKINIKRKLSLINIEMYVKYWNDFVVYNNLYIEHLKKIIKLQYMTTTINNKQKLTLKSKFLIFIDFSMIVLLANEICSFNYLSQERKEKRTNKDSTLIY